MLLPAKEDGLSVPLIRNCLDHFHWPPTVCFIPFLEKFGKWEELNGLYESADYATTLTVAAGKAVILTIAIGKVSGAIQKQMIPKRLSPNMMLAERLGEYARLKPTMNIDEGCDNSGLSSFS